MLILPERWPDESIYSLFAKIVRLNGLDHLRGAGMLAGEECPTSVLSCPVNIKHFYEATRGVYGSSRDLLHNATVFPALAHMGALGTTTLFEVESGTLKPELGLLAFGVHKGHQWRICRRCLESDAKIYGISYWHRAHQLLGSQYCTEHRLILDRLSPRRVDLLDHLVLPSDVLNELNHRVGAAGEPSSLPFDVSIQACDALADKSEPFSRDVIRATFKAELAKMGLLADNGRIRLAEYYADLGRRFGKERLSTCVGMRQSRLCNPSAFLHSDSDVLDPKPFASLLLTMFLFGSWPVFKEQCRWQDILGRSGDIINAAGLENTGLPSNEVMIKRQRQICLDYKTSRTVPTRHEFMRVSYRAFRWLRHNDRAWLDHELPQQSTKRQRMLFK